MWLLLFNMSEEGEVVGAHPEGEGQTTGSPAPQTSSLDTFAGKVHVKWSTEATVSSLGLMPFFIEFSENQRTVRQVGGGKSVALHQRERTPEARRAGNHSVIRAGRPLAVCPHELDSER